MRGEYTLLPSKVFSNMELPPRARRILLVSDVIGEGKELPPRARRIRTFTDRDSLPWGTTSACAENTIPFASASLRSRNYLRVRGEYRLSLLVGSLSLELPPRARRIPVEPHILKLHRGTTSACAENTAISWLGRPRHGNYLRVRGEYPRMNNHPSPIPELPPRARRIPDSANGDSADNGTTSACAENTPNHPANHSRNRNYLRVRGEYQRFPWWAIPLQELPPRARRIRTLEQLLQQPRGTTSACAENTRTGGFRCGLTRNYLRVRGEYHTPA